MDQDQTNQGEINKIKKLNRRKALNIIGVTAATSIVGISGVATFNKISAGTNSPLQDYPKPTCIVRPEQIEGPYFVDEKLHRQDIRIDPSDNSVKDGVELMLIFNVSQIEGQNCLPLPNAIVDLWQCDAAGIYSDVQDRNFDTRGKKFLRGYQMTNSHGSAQFLTIFPGWYRGRATHVHFKIRTDETSAHGYEFTSQIYFEDSQLRQIYNLSPYATQGKGYMENEKDSIYRNGGEELKIKLTKVNTGLQGIFDIGLKLS
jgi:protocatechuate 3,4-dioxygenase beta subunit